MAILWLYYNISTFNHWLPKNGILPESTMMFFSEATTLSYYSDSSTTFIWICLPCYHAILSIITLWVNDWVVIIPNSCTVQYLMLQCVSLLSSRQKCSCMIKWLNVNFGIRSRYLGHGWVITSHIILWDVITYSCLRFPLLAPQSSYA